MPMIVHNKHRLYYRFEGEKGAFLLLHHGWFGSHADWYDTGFVDALAAEFRLIVMDARGHGRSDRPLEPEAYRIDELSGDVIAIMDELDIRNLHFLGYSLGALVGYDLLTHHQERLRIAILGGEAPYFTEAACAQWRDWAGRLRQEGLGALLRHLSDTQLLATAQRPVDEEAERTPALAMLEAMAGVAPPPVERISVSSPVTLFTAEDDPAADRVHEARRSIYRARFVSLPNLNHAQVLSQREALLAEVLRLLKSGRKQAPELGSRAGSPQREPQRPAPSTESAAIEADGDEEGGPASAGAEAERPARSSGEDEIEDGASPVGPDAHAAPPAAEPAAPFPPGRSADRQVRLSDSSEAPAQAERSAERVSGEAGAGTRRPEPWLRQDDRPSAASAPEDEGERAVPPLADAGSETEP
jgi:pimeloyl-ACP methyl ester carboxylesterase